jgi:hypothetical protein
MHRQCFISRHPKYRFFTNRQRSNGFSAGFGVCMPEDFGGFAAHGLQAFQTAMK